MLKLVIGKRNKSGFTLIEILIVIVIVSITLSFAVIAFGDFGQSRRILFSADQLMHTIQLVQQKAILESGTFGLKIDNKSYQIYKYQQNNQWGTLSNKGIYKMNYFPQNTVINVKTEGASMHGGPNIIINSSGEMTPFSVEFKNNKNESLTLLTGTYDGNLKSNPVSSK